MCRDVGLLDEQFDVLDAEEFRQRGPCPRGLQIVRGIRAQMLREHQEPVKASDRGHHARD
jgi:hypothetical protein